MSRLKTLQPRIKTIDTSTRPVLTTSDSRMTGRRLQARRYSIWKRDPHCAGCGRVVGYPGGFELDHIVPLHKGGPDTDANSQLMCIRIEMIDGQRVKTGCHIDKTADDLRG